MELIQGQYRDAKVVHERGECAIEFFNDIIVHIKLLTKNKGHSDEYSKENPFYFGVLVYESLAISFIQIEDYKSAMESYQSALVMFPCSISVRFKMAQWIHAVSDSLDKLKTVKNILKNAIKSGSTLKGYSFIVKQEREFLTKAKEKLAFLYCQESSSKSIALLREMKYTHRLSSSVLNYPVELLIPDLEARNYVRAYDNFLTKTTLKNSQLLFAPDAPFWKTHAYNEYESNGYFSYIYKFTDPPTNYIEKLILKIFEYIKIEFPEKARLIRFAEYWARIYF
jgi:hypothetical protein